MAKPKKQFVLGSRGSALALAQANMVKGWLEKAQPDADIRLEIIKTTGDTDQDTRLDKFPVLGVFVKEIQNALRSGRIDLAVHSLKDVPEDQPKELTLAAFPPREDARDVFVSNGIRFADLPPKARVGTGSPRRIMQLRALRPDVEFVPVRGNVDTRLAKVTQGDLVGELAGVVLAAAGLRRLGRAEVITQAFTFSECVPAIGQASLGLECRSEDADARKLLAKLDDPLTSEAVHLERRFMLAVGGGCKVPMAAHAYPYGEGFRFLAVMGDTITNKLVRLERVLDADAPEGDIDAIAAEMLEECQARGIPTPRDL